MRALARTLIATVLLASLPLIGSPADAQQSPVPERRFVLSENVDLPGGDLASIFDTTIDACERACLTDSRCTAFTFNTRNGSCFPKADTSAAVPFAGAYSGAVAQTDPAVLAKAGLRRSELEFLTDYDIDQARLQAEGLGNQHITGSWTMEELLQSAAEAEANGDPAAASNFVGAALNITDSPEGWVDYARLLLDAGQPDGQFQRTYRDRAVAGATNAYLRAESPALRHTARRHGACAGRCDWQIRLPRSGDRGAK
jgi:hypothetical protein